MSKKIKIKPKKVLAFPESKSKVETERIKKTKIRVIGIGGGGCSIISEIASKIKKASFLAANTDLRALKILRRKVNRFQFGQNLTQGLGTGMNANLGREAAQSEKEEIKKIFSGQDLCVLVATLGGGTGSGASPIFAKIGKNLGVKTFGIFTLPFQFEGTKKMEIAKEALAKLRPNLNALSIIPNERIFQIIDKKTPLKQALSAINKNLTEALEGLIDMIYLPGLINIDLADLKTILEKRGKVAYLNKIEVQGSGKVEEAIKKLISSPLYPYTIRGAKGILFNIEGGKNLGLAEVSLISRTIHDLVNKEAKIIFGIVQTKKSQGKIKITLLATGCRTKLGVQSMTDDRKKNRQTKIKPKPSLIKKPKVKKIRARKKLVEKKSKKKLKIKPKKIIKKKRSQSKVKESDEIKVRVLHAPGVQRKNALQIKKEEKKEEEELIAKEKEWEFPAFLRRKKLTQ